MIAYSASKAAILSLTYPLAKELGPLGIRVMDISPGVSTFFATSQWRSLTIGQCAILPNYVIVTSQTWKLFLGICDTPMFLAAAESNENISDLVNPFPTRLIKPHDFGKTVKETIENPMLNGFSQRLDGALRTWLLLPLICTKIVIIFNQTGIFRVYFVGNIITCTRPKFHTSNLKRSWDIEQKLHKNESQLWRPLAAKQDNLVVSAQRHVIGPFISFLLFSGGFIQDVLNKRVMDDFLKKCTEFQSKLGIFWAYYTNGDHLGFSSIKVIF